MTAAIPPWKAHRIRKRLGLRSTYHNAIPWEERFYGRIDMPDGWLGCWLWRGAQLPDGYGQVRVGHTSTTAHRDAYTHLVGPIPEGLHLDHLCRVRLCVNPGHLEPVTQAENSRRSDHPHARKTHCKAGHPLSGSNLRLNAGKRVCIACAQIASRASYERSKAGV